MGLRSTPRKEIDYIPLYGGNRDSENPMWVRFQPLTRGESDNYRERIEFKERGGGFRQGRFRSNANQIQQQQFIDRVKEVHNFQDWETGEEITDIKKFYDNADDDLIEEIFNAMLRSSTLGEDEVKNSASQSDGASRAGTGIAKTARI